MSLGQGSEAQRQCAQAAHQRVLVPFQGIARLTKVRQTFEQPAKADAGFRPCQGGSQAEVYAEPESEMPVWSSSDVEPIWIGELVRVAIGRAQHGADLLVRAE